MKKKRLELILKTIEQQDISTQEELLVALREHGLDVTQATVSRDIKELGLIKSMSQNGRYRYSAPKTVSTEAAKNFHNIIAPSVLWVDYALNTVVIKCYAGMAQASGEYVSLIDADLQQRPEIVRNMVKILDEQPEYDVVAAYQDRRGEGKVLSFFKKSFYSIINKLSNVKLKADASDFRTFRRCVCENILELSEYHRFSKGIFAWVGYETCFIPYTACERVAGETKWNFRKLLNYAIDGIIGYSTAPLRLATHMGTISGIAAVLYLIVVILQKLIWGIDIPGYATIIVLLLFFGCIQLFCIGIIGEYVGRTFEQSKNRPVYIAKEILTYEEK